MKTTTAILLLSSLLLSAAFLSAQEARDTVRAVVARNAIPAQDTRNTVLSSRTHYTMPAFATREAWQERAGFLRKQILASAGLLPMREKRALNAQVFGKLERQGYSVEKVLLETLPGFYLGGNLYRPLGQQGPFPGVVAPHGHWAYGRLENTALVSVPGRAISMARQGYVVFTYDMVGQNDTDQIPHHWSEARHDLWNIGPMGIQLWDSIRATDFVSSLPDVDPTRIVATGASGGGTQTFFLMAVDDRIKAAAPVNMISATAQGGVCENAANLRAGWPDFSNMVVGALMAPRPLILISNGGDWTVETPKEVFPAIQSIYRLLGAEKNVANVHFPQFIHNYNKESREAVYQFFNQHILNKPAPVAEAAFRVDFPHELLALHGRSRPANAITGLDQLVDNMIREDRAMTQRLQPRDAATLATARDAFAEQLTFSLLALRPKAAELLSEKTSAVAMGEHLIIGRNGKGDRVPSVWLTPRRVNSEIAPTLIVHPNGVASVLSSPIAKALLNRGGIVMGIDAFQTGAAVAPRDTSNRAFASFNQTNDANRVQDILTALEYLRSRSKAQTVNLVGLEAAGIWSYFARALAGGGVNLAADLVQFAADTDAEYVDKFFVPGLRRAGDFHAASVLNTQGRSLIYNTSSQFPSDWARQAAKAAGSELDLRSGVIAEPDLVAWLTAQRRASRVTN
jgi:dienelactone hydrolase